MKTAVQQWGNSLALRIPKLFAEQVRVKKGTPVRLSVEKGRMIITPTAPLEISLKSLLKGVTAKNRHPVIDSGRPAGKELW